MLIVVAAIGTAFADEPQSNVASRPADDALTHAVVQEVPGVRLISIEFRDAPLRGGRIGCGLVDVFGVVEPFSVVTGPTPAKAARAASTFTFTDPNGRPVVVERPSTRAEPARWTITVAMPSRQDADSDGWDRNDRNGDGMQRRIALIACPMLQPPEGHTWNVSIEEDPDPPRATRARERARAAAAAIMGNDRD